MNRILFTIAFLLLSLVNASAQMSDEMVVEYVQQRAADGADQMDIAKELLKKGVSQSQMLRIKDKYEKQRSNGTNNPSATSDETKADRGRVQNGETEPDEVPQAEELKVKIFGHDIFRSKNLTFAPNMNIATPAKYVLGPGDEIILDIYGASQLSSKKTISPDGTIVVDQVGPVSVSGMTVEQAQARVRSKIGGYYQGSSIKLTVGQTRTIAVNVLGEVQTPGTYTLSAFSTVFNALYLAGGITDIGTLRNIKVMRNGRIISTVDVYDYIVNGRLSGNVMLQDNDVISVGTYENLVEIVGRVKRPMFYELKKSESLQSLLSLAGGFMGDAYKEKVRVERKSSDGLTVHNVDEWDLNSFHNEDGDIVVVAPIIERYKNTAMVSGAVFRPGKYKIGGDVNSVKTLVEQAGGLLEHAMTSRAVLHRMKADRTLQTITVNLDGIMRNEIADIMLENEDSLIISSLEKLNTSKFLYIVGNVQNPGRYTYSENETIEDLITEAGGLLETASVENVEVARRIINADDNPDGNQMAKIFTFNLNSSLSIEGESGFKLEPYDHVIIHRNPDYQEQKAVIVTGEVKYAGSYILSSKEQRLSEIIKRAGGFTSKAYVEGAQLTRRYTEKEMDMKRILVEIAPTAADSIEASKQLTRQSYTIGIDLAKAVASPGSLDDVILMEGDSIFIPQQNNVVKISGEVLHPNTVTYSKNKSKRYYLNQAGGVTEGGKKSKAYIVYANGQVSMLKKGSIQPGCEIVVPSKKEKPVDTAKVSMWATLASTVATVGAVVSNIIK